MEYKGRTFHVGILTKDEKATAALVQEFERIKDKKSVTLIDLVGMNRDLFKKFILNTGLDIVVIAEDTYTEPEKREKAKEIVQKSNKTYFMIIYNDENAERILEEAQWLVENKIVTTHTKITNERDYALGLATNVHGGINRKIQNERRAAAFLSELNRELSEGRRSGEESG